MQLLRKFAPLDGMKRENLAALVRKVSVRSLSAGRALFSQGDTDKRTLWLISGAAFGRYLAEFAFAYVSMYAGLASAMIALVFLYVCASIFIFCGELNTAIANVRDKPR